MVTLTPAQIRALAVNNQDDQTFTISQHYRGHEESCDHISVESDARSFRIDNDGNLFDIQTKETSPTC
jgi:hypothetical protein